MEGASRTTTPRVAAGIGAVIGQSVSEREIRTGRRWRIHSVSQEASAAFAGRTVTRQGVPSRRSLCPIAAPSRASRALSAPYAKRRASGGKSSCTAPPAPCSTSHAATRLAASCGARISSWKSARRRIIAWIFRTANPSGGLTRAAAWAGWPVAARSSRLRLEPACNARRKAIERLQPYGELGPEPSSIYRRVAAGQAIAKRRDARHRARQVARNHAVLREQLEAMRVGNRHPPSFIGGNVKRDIESFLYRDQQAHGQRILKVQIVPERF